MKVTAPIGACLLVLAACGPGVEPSIPMIPTAPSPSSTPTAEAAESPTPTPSLDKKDRYYKNCTEAREAGAAPLRRGIDDGYRAALDRDKDGIACD
jgi:hypothetical protein